MAKKLPENPLKAAERLNLDLVSIRSKFGKKGAKGTLAKRYSIDPSTLSNYLRILELSDPVLELLDNNLLKLSHSIQLCAAPKEHQERLALMIIQGGRTRKDIAIEISNIKANNGQMISNKSTGKAIDRDVEKYLEMLEEDFGVSFNIAFGVNKITFCCTGYDQALILDLMFVKAFVFDESKFIVNFKSSLIDKSCFKIEAVLSDVDDLNLHLKKLFSNFNLVQKLRLQRSKRNS